jgi:hypothetical protein
MNTGGDNLKIPLKLEQAIENRDAVCKVWSSAELFLERHPFKKITDRSYFCNRLRKNTTQFFTDALIAPLFEALRSPHI